MFHPKKTSDQPNATKSLLIVEDATDVSSILASIIEEDGFSVDCCEDGDKALKLIRKKRYDVIYLGILMPKINGLDVLKTLKEENIEHGKIIIVTALHANVVINMISDLGASEYIDMNEFTIQQLADKLKLELIESDKQT